MCFSFKPNFQVGWAALSQLQKFGQFDGDMSFLDQRNNTVIENPYNFINELGNMVEPELANEDLELEDISNLTNEIHFNEQEFDDVFFNVGDRSWSFSDTGNLNLTGPVFQCLSLR